MNITINPLENKINHSIDINSSDKSISHRVCMFALFADSVCRISHFLQAEDTLKSLYIAQKLGLNYEFRDNELLLYPPKNGLNNPDDILFCGNSGTTMRLYTGLLSGANIYSILCGDKYLHARPMGRIVEPLRKIGANIVARKLDSKEVAPICITPNNKDGLSGFDYESKISSAQVKSAIILAGLQASSESSFKEVSLSRNHTENMITYFQRYNYLNVEKNIKILPFRFFETDKSPLRAFDISIPNDPSSAFFFAVLTCIIPDSELRLERVMMNETRIEAFRVLEKMGANISYENIQNGYENTADIVVKSAKLNSVEVSENISWLIDEIPALSIAFAMASGVSKVRNAKELRVKESDRIKVTLEGLKNFGIEVIEYEDGFDVVGGTLKKGRVDSKGDHRIAMSFAIASSLCGGEVLDCECINTSFPNFLKVLSSFTRLEIKD